MPMPSPDAPPPANPCNLASSAPDGPLGDALRAAGFVDVQAEEWPYSICVAGRDRTDVAARFLEGTPFHGDILAFCARGSYDCSDVSPAGMVFIYLACGVVVLGCGLVGGFMIGKNRGAAEAEGGIQAPILSDSRVV